MHPVIVEFHYEPCTLQHGPVHFHYTTTTMGTFTMDYAPCPVVDALPPSTLYMAPICDAVPVYTIQIRMIQFQLFTMHHALWYDAVLSGTMQNIPCYDAFPSCTMDRVPWYMEFPLCIMNRGLVHFHHPPCTLNL